MSLLTNAYFINQMARYLTRGELAMAGVVHDAWADTNLGECIEGLNAVKSIVGAEVYAQYEAYVDGGVFEIYGLTSSPP